MADKQNHWALRTRIPPKSGKIQLIAFFQEKFRLQWAIKLKLITLKTKKKIKRFFLRLMITETVIQNPTLSLKS